MDRREINLQVAVGCVLVMIMLLIIMTACITALITQTALMIPIVQCTMCNTDMRNTVP